jgi:hypothetical protein
MELFTFNHIKIALAALKFRTGKVADRSTTAKSSRRP